jgi:hypothetical protein
MKFSSFLSFHFWASINAYSVLVYLITCVVQTWASIKLKSLQAFQCMLICFLFLQQLGHFYACALNFEQWISQAGLVI